MSGIEERDSCSVSSYMCSRLCLLYDEISFLLGNWASFEERAIHIVKCIDEMYSVHFIEIVVNRLQLCCEFGHWR